MIIYECHPCTGSVMLIQMNYFYIQTLGDISFSKLLSFNNNLNDTITMLLLSN